MARGVDSSYLDVCSDRLVRFLSDRIPTSVSGQIVFANNETTSFKLLESGLLEPYEGRTQGYRNSDHLVNGLSFDLLHQPGMLASTIAHTRALIALTRRRSPQLDLKTQAGAAADLGASIAMFAASRGKDPVGIHKFSDGFALAVNGLVGINGYIINRHSTEDISPEKIARNATTSPSMPLAVPLGDRLLVCPATRNMIEKIAKASFDTTTTVDYDLMPISESDLESLKLYHTAEAELTKAVNMSTQRLQVEDISTVRSNYLRRLSRVTKSYEAALGVSLRPATELDVDCDARFASRCKDVLAHYKAEEPFTWPSNSMNPELRRVLFR